MTCSTRRERPTEQPSTPAFDSTDLTAVNTRLEALSATDRIDWALTHLPGSAIVTSSFGAQSAVMLHLMTQACPDIPVVVIDTGYLFPETYAFIDTLSDRLGLNLKVFAATLSPAWLEQRHGPLWEQGEQGLRLYNQLTKVEPMRQALSSLPSDLWFSGLRRQQSDHRASLKVVESQAGRYKIHPLIDWDSRQIHRYLNQHRLPYHPLWEQGYPSIGDVHSTRSIHEVDEQDQTRFFGLFRECGIHLLDDPEHR